MADWGSYYHNLASRMSLFRRANERLAELAQLRPGMAVLDLGAGTGLTAEAALAAVPEGLRLYLVDNSASMMRVAKEQLGERATGYHIADALSAPELGLEKVDRVLAGLSFFHFGQPERVLGQLRAVIKPMGWLCFSLSGTYMNTGPGFVTPQWAYLKAVHDAGLSERPAPSPERMPNQRSLEGTLHAAKFKPFKYDVLDMDFTEADMAPGGDLYQQLELDPPLPGADFHDSVRRSLGALEQVREAILSLRPRWRVAFFLAQPAISPEEALMMKFGNKLPGK